MDGSKFYIKKISYANTKYWGLFMKKENQNYLCSAKLKYLDIKQDLIRLKNSGLRRPLRNTDLWDFAVKLHGWKMGW